MPTMSVSPDLLIFGGSNRRVEGFEDDRETRGGEEHSIETGAEILCSPLLEKEISVDQDPSTLPLTNPKWESVIPWCLDSLHSPKANDER